VRDETVGRGADVQRTQDADVESRVPAVPVLTVRRRDRAVCRPAQSQLPARIRLCPRNRWKEKRRKRGAESQPHGRGSLAARPDQKISGHHGWRSQRKSASARSIAPAFSSITGLAGRTPANEAPASSAAPSGFTGLATY